MMLRAISTNKKTWILVSVAVAATVLLTAMAAFTLLYMTMCACGPVPPPQNDVARESRS